ncbi:MAG: DUF2804 family protein [Solirubrobacteraceae bacterium]
MAAVRIGPARQSFWAVWDRRAATLHERTALGRGDVRLARGIAEVDARRVTLTVALAGIAGIETIAPSGASHAWTRKQGGILARATIAVLGDAPRRFEARAVIDDTAAYYERHTRWRWSAGVGAARDGRELAWNLVEGVNDPPVASERTVWVEGVAQEVGAVRFAPDLGGVSAPGAELRFSPEAVRERRQNLGLVRSRYRRPFGTFSGQLPGAGIELAEGYGVMEDHDVWW